MPISASVASLATQLATIEARVQFAEARAKRTEQALKVATAELARLMRDIDKARALREQMTLEIAQMQSVRRKMLRRVESARKIITWLEDDTKRLEQERDTLEAQKSELRADIRSLRTGND